MLPFQLEEALREVAQLRGRNGLRGGLVAGIATDSRAVAPGTLFVALEGERTDGHRFVGEALARGAVGCVVRRGKRLNGVASDRLVDADDPLRALAGLAAFVRRRLSCRVIGITGSLGKTTTKEILGTILSARFETVRAPKSFNNAVGVPLTVFEATSSTEVLVAELGANHPGEIADLAGVLMPTIGVVVSIAPVHLEGFGSIEGVIRAKAELAAALPGDGVLHINGAVSGLEVFRARARCAVKLFGEGSDSGGRILAADAGGLTISVGRHGSFRIPGACRQHLTSAVGAIAVALDLGMEPEAVRAALNSFTMPGLRWQKERVGGVTFVLDCYNASPDSVRGALESAADLVEAGGRLVVVLGDMLELGDESVRFHREVGRLLGESSAGVICLHGERMRDAYEVLSGGRCQGETAFFQDRDAMASWLTRNLAAGDVVLVKGSRGLRLEEVARKVKECFDKEDRF